MNFYGKLEVKNRVRRRVADGLGYVSLNCHAHLPKSEAIISLVNKWGSIPIPSGLDAYNEMCKTIMHNDDFCILASDSAFADIVRVYILYLLTLKS